MALLVDRDGKPVWPLVDDSDRNMLQAVAGTFGATLADVEADVGVPAVDPEAGIVYGPGEVRRTGELYAHLTARRWVCGAHDALPGTELPEIVIGQAGHVDIALQQWLLGLPRGAPLPGIIWGRTTDELRRRTMTAAAAADLRGPAATTARLDVIVTSPTGVVRAGRRVMVGAGGEPEEIRDLLTRRTGLLTIVAHGNPWSVRLHPDLALCMLHEPAPDAPPSMAPHCVQEGYCPTVRRPVAQAMERGHLVDPDTLSARLVVLNSCRAVAVGNDVIAPEWGYLPQLLDNPAVGVVLATPEMGTMGYGELAAELLVLLEAGERVGEALSRFEMAPGATRLEQRFLIFGDPRTAVAEGRWPADPGARRPGADEDPPAPRGSADIEILRTLTDNQRDDDPRSGTTALALSHALDALEAIATMPTRRAKIPRAAALVRKAALRHIATLKGLTPFESVHASVWERAADLAPCPCCGWRTKPYRLVIDDLKRSVVLCPRCGTVANLPEASSLAVEVAFPEIRLTGEVPAGAWDGGIFVVPGRAADLVTSVWPADRRGRPARSMTLAANRWPTGPLDIRLVLIIGLRLYAVACQGRAA
jgi:hypothetical protein